ncbi:hypothetical protein H5P27_12220 [Pelagicoccus albus]|uniref:Uncharacterized protein n=2 Tax=Pelagicoccus albus TaxID=415222 RepID=A0A7X1B9G0_9BACT|nr:hypothetical protein [Pelagicoccus albus]
MVNSITHGRASGFDQEAMGFGTRRDSNSESGTKQSVNISEETLLKAARAKLSRMVSQKRAYDQRGLLSPETQVGSLLSARA